MAKKKRKNGGGMSMVRKAGKTILSGLRVVVGIVGYGHGLIGALTTEIPSGNFVNIPNATIYRYTGFDPATGNLNTAQTITSVGILAGTTVTLAILSYGIRHL